MSQRMKKAIGRASSAMIRFRTSRHSRRRHHGATNPRHFPPELRATVVTHSQHCGELVNHREIEVVLIAEAFKHSVVSVGAAAIEAISRIHADYLLHGGHGHHPEIGLSTGDLEKAHIKRALSPSAAETIVMASSEKLNTASP